MPPNFATVTMEIKNGPALSLALDVLIYAQDLFKLIPECHEAERKKLIARSLALWERVREMEPVRGKK